MSRLPSLDNSPSIQNLPSFDSITRDFQPSDAATPALALVLLAISRAKFLNEEVILIGRFDTDADGTLLIAELIVDKQRTVEVTSAEISKVQWAPAKNRHLENGIAVIFGRGAVPELSSQAAMGLEAIYQFDLDQQIVTVHYRQDHQDSSAKQTAETWADSLAYLLENFEAERDEKKTVGEIGIANEATQAKVIEFGCSEQHQQPSFYSLEPSTDFTFHRHFEKQVKKTPNRTAVWAKEKTEDAQGLQWTYRQLNQEANAIARRLIEAGVGIEDRVGVVMDRRCCMLATTLGIMKAGARFVGMEPNLPIDRLYTSGSTGKPKAVDV